MNIPLKQAVEEVKKLCPTEHVMAGVEYNNYSNGQMVVKFCLYTVTTSHVYSEDSIQDCVNQASEKLLAKQNGPTTDKSAT